ncbi:carbohydrate ABC transporter permease [Cohnella herbarum]|uniref:Carbohydrate ABC transporter permease n=1 Tax=Cohnella herbarum TaxID=2728023 RepID=A0A7Z2VG85_9BACL|nr:carbohydrate ABC transporter permease [Cohnella herbarum]QJD82547.1 carbohydrate ABC transporter permease [Cohnella herbarum]
MRRKESVFQSVNGTLLAVVGLMMLAPIVHLLAVSLSDPIYAQAKLVSFWPKGFSVVVYEKIFAMKEIWRSMGVSVYISAFGTLLTLIVTSMTAFALSRPFMPYRKWAMGFLIITFIFPVPLIPEYLLVKSLNMLDTLWALMIPGLTGVFNIIIMKTFFQNVSGEIVEAAKIDGCGEAGIYWRIVLPLSTAVIATIGLFHAVGQWNSYFGALIYLRSKELWPIQVLLQNLVVKKNINNMMGNTDVNLNLATTPEMMSAGIIIVAMLPILLVYPFLQKYFVKGAMLGSLKE